MTKLQLGCFSLMIFSRFLRPKNGQVQMVNAMRDVLSMDGHDDKEDEDEIFEKKETVELRLKSIDVSEHVNA